MVDTASVTVMSNGDDCPQGINGEESDVSVDDGLMTEEEEEEEEEKEEEAEEEDEEDGDEECEDDEQGASTDKNGDNNGMETNTLEDGVVPLDTSSEQSKSESSIQIEDKKENGNHSGGQKRKQSSEGASSSSATKKKRKSKKANQRRNIKQILSENDVGEATIRAQQEEFERLRKVEERAAIAKENFNLSDEVILSSDDEEVPRHSNSLIHDDDIIEIEPHEVGVGNFHSRSPRVPKFRKPREDYAFEFDATDCGAHTDDRLNVPDEQGRVLVNVGYSDDEELIYLPHYLSKKLKPHQIGGVRFLYDNVMHGETGAGCILAHSMGLGKTLQIITFIDTYLTHTKAKHVLCIVPINTIQNWLSEFDHWLPSSRANLFRAGDDRKTRDFQVYMLNDCKTLNSRTKEILAWRRTGGVLLLGYEMYKILTTEPKPSNKPSNKTKKKPKSSAIENLSPETYEYYREELRKALVDPGPDLVVCDEGHRIKNCNAATSQALKKIQTRRRIVLTGYPLQNNLIEYWCMVDFVRPNYLGSRQEFSNMFERPISNGQCIDSTPTDRLLMMQRAHVLCKLLKGFVQRRSHWILANSLPRKHEHVILVRMTDIQRSLMLGFLEKIKNDHENAHRLNPIILFSVFVKIWNHPDILYKIATEGQSIDDLDIDLVGNLKNKAPFKKDPDTKVTNGVQRNGNGSSDPYSVHLPSNNQTCSSTSKASIKNIPHSNSMPSVVSQSSHDSCMFQTDKISTDYDLLNSLDPYSVKNSCRFAISGKTETYNSYLNYETSSTGHITVQNMRHEKIENSFHHISHSKSSIFSTTLSTNHNLIRFDLDRSNTSPSFVYSQKSVNNLNSSRFSNFVNSKGTSSFFDEPSQASSLYDPSSTSSSTQLQPYTPNPPPQTFSSSSRVMDYGWAEPLIEEYKVGVLQNGLKMVLFFEMLDYILKVGDKLLVFSHSLFTLDTIEHFLCERKVSSKAKHGAGQRWAKNVNYFRLDGSTSAVDREKLINNFNSKSEVHLFLLSTKAGSLGINLIGANRIIVFDASWNPCHDAQAACRIYRYGQRKECHIYRLVCDDSLEKRIYDKQITKQETAYRVVDELNPDTHFTRREIESLINDLDNIEIHPIKEFTDEEIDRYQDDIIRHICKKFNHCLTKSPFEHESLLLDNKETKLSQHQKRIAEQQFQALQQEKSRARNELLADSNRVNTLVNATGLNLPQNMDNFSKGYSLSYQTSDGLIPWSYMNSMPSAAPGSLNLGPASMANMLGQSGSMNSLPQNNSLQDQENFWKKNGYDVNKISFEADLTFKTGKVSRLIPKNTQVLLAKSPQGDSFLITSDGVKYPYNIETGNYFYINELPNGNNNIGQQMGQQNTFIRKPPILNHTPSSSSMDPGPMRHANRSATFTNQSQNRKSPEIIFLDDD